MTKDSVKEKRVTVTEVVMNTELRFLQWYIHLLERLCDHEVKEFGSESYGKRRCDGGDE